MNWLTTLVKKWQGLSALAIAALVWVVSPKLIRLYDPVSGVFDGGVLQIPLFAFICISFGIFLSWLFIRLEFPTIDTWIDSGRFTRDWRNIEPCERIKYSIYLFLGLLFAFVALCRVL